MKLGIAVVYMVSERNERLLELHLSQIEKNTTLPYTIYAAVNRLLPQFREKLEAHRKVKICPCESYVAGSGLLRHERGQAGMKGGVHQDCKYEHSWYLEQLIRQAIDDGVTHVAVFHVDSFPIQHGWDRELIARLSDRCVLAGTVRDEKTDYKPLTAGILFPREFYLKYRPRLLLTEKELNSADYQRYRQACPHCGDSGVGYGFRIFVEGLMWHPLFRSNGGGGDHALFGAVHGDMIFHLTTAAVVDQQNVIDCTVRPSQRRGLLGAMARLSIVLIPARLRRTIRSRISGSIREWYRSKDRQEWERERAMLLDDPERYLAHLRTGAALQRRSRRSEGVQEGVRSDALAPPSTSIVFSAPARRAVGHIGAGQDEGSAQSQRGG